MLLAPASSYGISGEPITHALGNSSAPTVLSYLIQIGALVATTSAGARNDPNFISNSTPAKLRWHDSQKSQQNIVKNEPCPQTV